MKSNDHSRNNEMCIVTIDTKNTLLFALNFLRLAVITEPFKCQKDLVTPFLTWNFGKC